MHEQLPAIFKPVFDYLCREYIEQGYVNEGIIRFTTLFAQGFEKHTVKNLYTCGVVFNTDREPASHYKLTYTQRKRLILENDLQNKWMDKALPEQIPLVERELQDVFGSWPIKEHAIQVEASYYKFYAPELFDVYSDFRIGQRFTLSFPQTGEDTFTIKEIRPSFYNYPRRNEVVLVPDVIKTITALGRTHSSAQAVIIDEDYLKELIQQRGQSLDNKIRQAAKKAELHSINSEPSRKDPER